MLSIQRVTVAVRSAPPESVLLNTCQWHPIYRKISTLLLLTCTCMKTPLRPIGNSRGIILPAALLATIAFEDEVEMTIQDNRIILEPVKKSKPLRQGWYPQALVEATPETVLSEAEANDWDAVSGLNEEWTWSLANPALPSCAGKSGG